jgi:hypothetical protein
VSLDNFTIILRNIIPGVVLHREELIQCLTHREGRVRHWFPQDGSGSSDQSPGVEECDPPTTQSLLEIGINLWNTTPVANSCSAFSLEIGWTQTHKAVTHPSTDFPDVAALLYSNRGNRCFNIARPLPLEFGLHCMIRQPSADTHVIWVARHKPSKSLKKYIKKFTSRIGQSAQEKMIFKALQAPTQLYNYGRLSSTSMTKGSNVLCVSIVMIFNESLIKVLASHW